MDPLQKGLWPVMLTPFSEDYQVDIDTLKELTEFYIQAGAHGLFANCLSSEMFQLTAEEKILITRTVVEEVNGRIPVVSTGTFGQDPDKNSDFIKKLFDTGVQAVVINTNQPVDRFRSEKEFRVQLEKLLDLTPGIPLGTYECPVPYKRLISVELMSWIGKTGRFLYHKDTSYDPDEIKEKIRVTRDTPLGIYNANTPTALGSLQAGGAGISPIGANFYPEFYSGMIEKTRDSDPDLKNLNHLLTLLDSTTDNKYYPLSAKLFLRKRGMNILPVLRLTNPAPEKPYLLKLDALLDLLFEQSGKLGIKLVNF